MKYLKVENNKGYYLKNDASWVSLDSLDKEHLYYLIEKALEEDYEMDEYISENLANPAHNIIYKKIYEKLSEIHSSRERFQDECRSMYKESMEKYMVD